MLKVIIDTSVFLAALGSKTNGSPVQILDGWVEGKFAWVMSPQLFLTPALFVRVLRQL